MASSQFEGKVVVLTGAGSGIGMATALLLADQGARLILCDVSAAGLEDVANRIERQTDTRPDDVVLDIAVPDQHARIVDAVARAGRPLDVLISNAGLNMLRPMSETTVADWERIHAVNAKGPYFLIKALAPRMAGAEAPAIVTVSSGAGVIAPLAGLTAYSSSKGAVIALTRACAKEFAPAGIRVNCVVPGIIDTAMSRSVHAEADSGGDNAMEGRVVARAMNGRMGRPEEVARAVLFLASPESSYMTGAVVPVDAGFTAS